MDNIKDDKYYVDKIVKSIDIIDHYMKNKTVDDLENDLLLNNTVMFQMICISENIASLSEEFKNQRSNIPWNMIKGTRNVIVHNYEGVIYNTLYDTVINDLPLLKEELLK